MKQESNRRSELNRRLSRRLAPVLAILGGVFPCAAQSSSTTEITLRVYNYSLATKEDLRELEFRATEILNHSGIELRWIQCSPILEDAGLSSQCGLPLRETAFQLLITTGLNGLRSHALATTIPGSSVITLSYKNGNDLAALDGSPVGRVLAHAAVHELGHILIGTKHHAPAGIMKARFGREDLEDMARGWLVFMPEQNRVIRSRLFSASEHARPIATPSQAAISRTHEPRIALKPD